MEAIQPFKEEPVQSTDTYLFKSEITRKEKKFNVNVFIMITKFLKVISYRNKDTSPSEHVMAFVKIEKYLFCQDSICVVRNTLYIRA